MGGASSSESAARLDTTGGGTTTAPLSARSRSTASRKGMPSNRITQSITDPPAWHAPRQCHRFAFGLITSDGVLSSWNGQQPIRSRPCRLSTIPAASTLASYGTRSLSCSNSESGMRGMVASSETCQYADAI